MLSRFSGYCLTYILIYRITLGDSMAVVKCSWKYSSWFFNAGLFVVVFCENCWYKCWIKVHYFVVKPWWIFIIIGNCLVWKKVVNIAKCSSVENIYFFVNSSVSECLLPIQCINCSSHELSDCIFIAPDPQEVRSRIINL